MGYSPRGVKELDTTEVTEQAHTYLGSLRGMLKMLSGTCGEKAPTVAFADFLGFTCIYLS